MITRIALTASLLAAGLAPALMLPAAAQTPPPRYDLPELNFDMWCQEQMHYSPQRCDQRLPKDDQAFKALRATYEKYEMRRLKNQRRAREQDQTLFHDRDMSEPGTNRPTPGDYGTIPEPH